MNKRGFTLIEILVVIVIVGLLAAILIPVFGKAREYARRAQCINNLRQHGIAWYLYLDEHNECFPQNGITPSQGGVDSEFTSGGKQGLIFNPDYGAQYRVLNRYLDIYDEASPDIGLFHCPDDTKPISPVLMNPDNFTWWGTSYYFNSRIRHFGPAGGEMPRPLSTITSPVNRVLLEMDNWTNRPGHGGNGYVDGITPVLVLFVDGHVSLCSYENDFEDWDVNTDKRVLWDPNGTEDLYD